MRLYRAHVVDDDHPEQYGFHWDPEWRSWLAWMASLPDDLPFDVELLKEPCYSLEVHLPEASDDT